jgi:hypothetical protein
LVEYIHGRFVATHKLNFNRTAELDSKAVLIASKIIDNAETEYLLTQRFLKVFAGCLTYRTDRLAKVYAEWQARIMLNFSYRLPMSKEKMEDIFQRNPNVQVDNDIHYVDEINGNQ